MRRFNLSTPAILLLACFFYGCPSSMTTRDAWTDVLQPCSSSDLLGEDFVFFGASNTLGVGSVLRKTDNKSYSVSFSLNDLGIGSDKIKTIVHENAEANCLGKSKVTISGDVALSIASLSAITGDLKSSISEAKQVTVSVDAWRLENLVEDNYELAVKNLGAGNIHYQHLREGNRYVIDNAVWVRGLNLVIEFNKAVKGSLEAKTPSIVIGGTKDDKVEFTTNWVSDNMLKLTCTNPIYIAGNLAKYSENGFQEAQSHFVMDKSSKKDVLVTH